MSMLLSQPSPHHRGPSITLLLLPATLSAPLPPASPTAPGLRADDMCSVPSGGSDCHQLNPKLLAGTGTGVLLLLVLTHLAVYCLARRAPLQEQSQAVKLGKSPPGGGEVARGGHIRIWSSWAARATWELLHSCRQGAELSRREAVTTVPWEWAHGWGRKSPVPGVRLWGGSWGLSHMCVLPVGCGGCGGEG